MRVVRNEDQLDAQIGKALEFFDTGESKYSGMVYEEGILALYDWLIGNTEDLPMEDD